MKNYVSKECLSAVSHKTSVRFAFLLCSLMSLSACKQEAPTGGAGPGAGPNAGPPTLVVTVPATVIEWKDQIQAIGTTQANESITISAKVTETVARINFADGEKVRAGDVLVELTGRAEVAALKEAQFAYKDAERQRERLSAIVKQGTVTQSQLDQQTAVRDQANARSEAIRARLSDRVILAPFSGLVGFRMISPGALVTPGTAITTLDDVSSLKLDFTVPEMQLAAVHIGDKVTASSSAYPGKIFQGDVVSIDSRIDPATRAIKVRARIENPDLTLRSGMLMATNLQARTRNALSVPEIAVQQQGAQAFVYRVDGKNIAERVDVRVGARHDGMVEIIEGLNVSDAIVTDGSGRLRQGAAVKLMETDTTPVPPASSEMKKNGS
jgi:membrane fusion protein, multidrug efflux system